MSIPTPAGAGAVSVAVLHFAFVVTLVGGAVVVRRRPSWWPFHLPVVAAMALVTTLGLDCPLTVWENTLRRWAGWDTYDTGFVSHYLVEPWYRGGVGGPIPIVIAAAWLVPSVAAYVTVARTYQRRRSPALTGPDGLARTAVLGAKVLLGVLLLHALAFHDLPQYQHKGMGYRLVLYPAAASLVPFIWWLRTRGRPPAEVGSYPYLVDLCVVLPFLLDTAGNAAGLYDRVSWFDDAMHVATWVPLVTAFGLVRRRATPDRLATAGLTVGFGAVMSVLWEIAEYLTFVTDNPHESSSAYRDTIGDLAGSLTGSIIAAVLVAAVRWPSPAPVHDGPEPELRAGRPDNSPESRFGRAVPGYARTSRLER